MWVGLGAVDYRVAMHELNGPKELPRRPVMAKAHQVANSPCSDILALDLYFQFKGNHPGKTAREVV
jgi:hypothetical protein